MVYTWASGSKYDGEWKDGQSDGHGILTDKNGTYDGEWKNNMKNGKGIYSFANGYRFEGLFQNDKFLVGWKL